MEQDAVTVPVPVTWQQIESTLCSAWEGGSNYWLECYDFVPPTDPADAAKVEYRYQNALYPGGACLCRLSHETGGWQDSLTREKLIAGLTIMATKYPRHFSHLVQDNGDAETGDVFLQCSLLSDVVYG